MFDISKIRSCFPALNTSVDGLTPVFFDGPGGTQVPQEVLDAMTEYLGSYNSNLVKSSFFAVEETHAVVEAARRSAAAFVNTDDPDEIIFSGNMSTLTAHMSRSISREWQEGDEIIVTALDHYANVSFWRQAAEDRGVVVHQARISPEDCTLDYGHLEELLSPKTRLVAFTLASNVCGSLTEAQRIVKAAQSVGALTYVDSVHYAPHFLPNVKALNCDFLVCSGYKFFGPHMGFLYGKKEHLERLKPYKVEPAPAEPPECWETGTKNFEALAGFSGCVAYLASLGQGENLRAQLEHSYDSIKEYEFGLIHKFFEGASSVNGLKIYGITDQKRFNQRTSTFAFTIDGFTPQEISDHLAGGNIATGPGHFYGVGVTDALGLTEKGGVVRAGMVHYNTEGELDQFFKVLDELS